MALTSRTQGHLLPCGRPLEDLWDRLDDPVEVDGHEHSCPHCRTARQSLHALAAATRAVYQDESLAPPPSLRGWIMAAVRAEVRRGERLPLPPGEFGPVKFGPVEFGPVEFGPVEFGPVEFGPVEFGPVEFGPVDISEQAVAVVLRYAADTVDGVRARHCRLHQAPEAGPSSMSVRVEMSIAVRYSQHTTLELVDVVRARIASAAAAQVGLPLSQIDIEIEDVYEDVYEDG